MSPTLIELCPFKPQYAESAVAVILSIQQTEFNIPISLEAQPDLLNIPGFYQRGVGNFWVALFGDEVVGTVGLLDIGNSQAALRKMFVKSSFRGIEYRVGKRLLDTLFQWCRSHGVREIYLGTTEKLIVAHRFYERNGFREIIPPQLPTSFPVMSVDTKFYLMNR
jgi:GNAT superfamily N-acetyltransferase